MKSAVSDKMVALLRECELAPNGIRSLPYRQGAARTAQALKDRGLLLYWSKSRWKSTIALSDAGRAFLAALPSLPPEPPSPTP